MTTKRSLQALTLAGLLLHTTGCATILKGGGQWGQVQYRNVPELEGEDALQIWVDGQPVDYQMQFSKVVGDMVYFEPTVDLSTKSSHEMRVRVGGCEAVYTVKPKVNGWWIVLDLTVGMGIGLFVDLATGAWKEFGSSAYDYLPALMAELGKPVSDAPKIDCGTGK